MAPVICKKNTRNNQQNRSQLPSDIEIIILQHRLLSYPNQRSRMQWNSTDDLGVSVKGGLPKSNGKGNVNIFKSAVSCTSPIWPNVQEKNENTHKLIKMILVHNIRNLMQVNAGFLRSNFRLPANVDHINALSRNRTQKYEWNDQIFGKLKENRDRLSISWRIKRLVDFSC